MTFHREKNFLLSRLMSFKSIPKQSEGNYDVKRWQPRNYRIAIVPLTVDSWRERNRRIRLRFINDS